MDLAELPSSEFRRHPWEISRWSFFARVLRARGVFERPARVLDVGSGDAWFLMQLMRALQNGSTGVGWDIGYDARPPTADATLGASLQFTHVEPTAQFDLVLMLDVLEHVEHDSDFLARRVATNIAPGGILLFSVPAWPLLFTSHDMALGHYRRYTPAAVVNLLQSHGLEILNCGGLFHSLTLPRAVARVQERLRLRPRRTLPDRLEWRRGSLVTWAVASALRIDNQLSWLSGRHRLRLPGLSFWALCTPR
jgi:SAM-dependent methyltransferase